MAGESHIIVAHRCWGGRRAGGRFAAEGQDAPDEEPGAYDKSEYDHRDGRIDGLRLDSSPQALDWILGLEGDGDGVGRTGSGLAVTGSGSGGGFFLAGLFSSTGSGWEGDVCWDGGGCWEGRSAFTAIIFLGVEEGGGDTGAAGIFSGVRAMALTGMGTLVSLNGVAGSGRIG